MMLRLLKRRVPMVLVVLVACSVVLGWTGGVVASASAASGPYWGNATTYTTSVAAAEFSSASCPSAGNCVAAGATETSSGTQPVVAAENGGTWGNPSPAAISGASSPNGYYVSVSCSSASLCNGVGYNQGTGTAPIAGPILLSGSTATAITAATVSLPSTLVQPSASPEDAALVSVSCLASGCTAVGWYDTNVSNVEQPIMATSSGGGSWSAATVTPPAGATSANLTAVSCPPGGPCEAVGNYVDGSGHVQSWSVQLGGGSAQPIMLPSNAVAVSATLPSAPSYIGNLTNEEGMNAISCPSSGVCTAVGQYSVAGSVVDSMVVNIANGTPAQGVTLPASGEHHQRFGHLVLRRRRLHRGRELHHSVAAGGNAGDPL
jgi:hypothetical protein